MQSAAPAPVGGVSATPVPFTRLDNSDPRLLAELLEVVERVSQAAAFTLGEEVEGFEREFASGAKPGKRSESPRAPLALELALRALDIGPGDEVIVPADASSRPPRRSAGAAPCPASWTSPTGPATPEPSARLSPRTRA